MEGWVTEYIIMLRILWYVLVNICIWLNIEGRKIFIKVFYVNIVKLYGEWITAYKEGVQNVGKVYT